MKETLLTNYFYVIGVCEQVEFHENLKYDGAFEIIISMALQEDIELQEYSAFSLAHLASNKDYQIELVNLGAVRPLVTMLSSDAEPKHYAGLALLKLADNFENHLKIAEAGGIQALLRLSRTRSSDEQLQYKAALSVGQLASNAVRLLPSNINDRTSNNIIGHGSRVLNRMRINDGQTQSVTSGTTVTGSVTASRGRGGELTNEYLNRSLRTTGNNADNNHRLMSVSASQDSGLNDYSRMLTSAAMNIGTNQSVTSMSAVSLEADNDNVSLIEERSLIDGTRRLL